MTTEELIAMLAAGGDRPPAHRARMLGVLGAAVLASLGLMLATLGALPRLGGIVGEPAFWLKVAFTGSMCAAAWHAAAALARPGARTATLPAVLVTPLLALWIVASLLLSQAPPEARAQMVLGQTWRVCPLLIAMLSAPLLAAAMWAMRSMAPTRLRLAGGAAGLAAGAAAALIYCLHCPEMSPGFVGCWYVAGMLIPATLGALIGPKVLAW